MNNVNKYLDEAKAKLGLPSDNQLAIKLDLTRAAISNYRMKDRTIDNCTAFKLAELLNIEPLEIIAEAEAERERDDKRKAYWQAIAQRERTKRTALEAKPEASPGLLGGRRQMRITGMMQHHWDGIERRGMERRQAA